MYNDVNCIKVLNGSNRRKPRKEGDEVGKIDLKKLNLTHKVMKKGPD